MSFRLYSQRDPAWSSHPLGYGSGVGTIGQYGCLDSCFAMIATDTGNVFNPGGIDDLFKAKSVFVREGAATYDLLPDQALDRAFPGHYRTASYAGFQPALISSTIASRYGYVILYISTGAVPTHFVIGYAAGGQQIADPWTGHVGLLSAYGGPGAVKRTIVVTYVPSAPVVPPQPSQPVPAPPVNPTPAAPIAPLPPTEAPPVAPLPLPVPSLAPPHDLMARFLALLQAVILAIARLGTGR